MWCRNGRTLLLMAAIALGLSVERRPALTRRVRLLVATTIVYNAGESGVGGRCCSAWLALR